MCVGMQDWLNQDGTFLVGESTYAYRDARWMDECMDRRMNVACMDGWMNRCVHVWVDGWVCRWMRV